jgi:hypothetical protein
MAINLERDLILGVFKSMYFRQARHDRLKKIITGGKGGHYYQKTQ